MPSSSTPAMLLPCHGLGRPLRERLGREAHPYLPATPGPHHAQLSLSLASHCHHCHLSHMLLLLLLFLLLPLHLLLLFEG